MSSPEDRLAALETKVADLSEAMNVLLAAAEKDKAKKAANTPRLLPGDPPEDDELETWVAWVRLNYQPVSRADQIPECWGEHPGLVNELTTLHATWREDFQTNPNAGSAQLWHDRWFPGVLQRMRVWVPRKCIEEGQHRIQSTQGKDEQ